MKSRWNWGSITYTLQNIPLINGNQQQIHWSSSPARTWRSYYRLSLVLRIRDVYSGTRIRIFSIPDPNFFPSRIPDPHQRIKYVKPKKLSKLSKIQSGLLIQDRDAGSRSWFFTHPRSRIQGSKRQRISDPQNWTQTRILLLDQDPSRHEILNRFGICMRRNRYEFARALRRVRIRIYHLAVLGSIRIQNLLNPVSSIKWPVDS